MIRVVKSRCGSRKLKAPSGPYGWMTIVPFIELCPAPQLVCEQEYPAAPPGAAVGVNVAVQGLEALMSLQLMTPSAESPPIPWMTSAELQVIWYFVPTFKVMGS